MSQKLSKILEQNKNIILGMKGCPYCINASTYLINKCIDFVYISKEKNKEIDDEIRKIREKLPEESMRRHTYPAVFINEKIVGGYSELTKYDFNKS